MLKDSKKESTVRVLSVDWDYFVDASEEERVYLFPDGGNEGISGSISDIVWSSRYADSKRCIDRGGTKFRYLADIPLKSDYLKMRAKLRKLSPSIPVLVADSHAHAYNFILDMESPVDVVNIDFHHDLYSQGIERDELNCGNWLKLLFDMGHVNSITWVKHEVSCQAELKDAINITTDLSDVLGLDYDALFLCRSRVWSPPHLDKNFISVFKFIQSHFTSVGVIDKGLLVDRQRQIKDYMQNLLLAEMQLFSELNKK
jgi:hypothetical protein